MLKRTFIAALILGVSFSLHAAERTVLWEGFTNAS